MNPFKSKNFKVAFASFCTCTLEEKCLRTPDTNHGGARQREEVREMIIKREKDGEKEVSHSHKSRRQIEREDRGRQGVEEERNIKKREEEERERMIDRRRKGIRVEEGVTK